MVELSYWAATLWGIVILVVGMVLGAYAYMLVLARAPERRDGGRY